MGDAEFLARACELGITDALSGRDAAAESVFVSLLSRSPGDARALNNLGNVYLCRGSADVAMAFYARAAEADSLDAGTVLNQSTALMMAGEDDAARSLAVEGIELAGGPEKAARLLGLRLAPSGDDGRRGADRAQVSRDEVLAMLKTATKAIPADSVIDKASAAPKAPKSRRQALPWRPAGVRGAAESDVASVLYWKR